MKNITKKAVSLILAAVMMVPMGLSAYAESLPVIDMGTFHNIYNPATGGPGDGDSADPDNPGGPGSSNSEGFDISDWDYSIITVDGVDTLCLYKYKGNDREITIYGEIEKDGVFYPVTVGHEYNFDTGEFTSFIAGNEIVEKITFIPVNGTPVGSGDGGTLNEMFRDCTALREVDFNNGLTGIGGTPIEQINGMFRNCTSLTKVDLSGLDLSQCREANETYEGCTAIRKASFEGVDFGNLKYAAEMFKGCVALESVDLTGAVWSHSMDNTTGMFEDDPGLKEITVSPGFNPGIYSADLFKTDKLTELTIKGETSEKFRDTVFPALDDDNRYIGEVEMQAHVELKGAALKDSQFSFTLYGQGTADDNVISRASNDGDGLISFGTMKIQDISDPLEFFVVMDEDMGVITENAGDRCIEKSVRIGLNEDGSLYIKE